MNTLELLKELLNIEKTDSTKDNILNSNIKKAEKAIKKYSSLTNEDMKNYIDEIVDLAFYYYNNQKNIGIRHESQGNRSKSYEIDEIPTSIKARLPLPSLRMW